MKFFSRVKTSLGKSEKKIFFFLAFHKENFPQPSFLRQGIFAKDSILDFWQSSELASTAQLELFVKARGTVKA